MLRTAIALTIAFIAAAGTFCLAAWVLYSLFYLLVGHGNDSNPSIGDNVSWLTVIALPLLLGILLNAGIPIAVITFCKVYRLICPAKSNSTIKSRNGVPWFVKLVTGGH